MPPKGWAKLPSQTSQQPRRQEEKKEEKKAQPTQAPSQPQRPPSASQPQQRPAVAAPSQPQRPAASQPQPQHPPSAAPSQLTQVPTLLQPGSKGQRIQLISNFFGLKLNCQEVYRYSLYFPAGVNNEDIPKKRSIIRMVGRSLREDLGDFEFDGTQVVAFRKITSGEARKTYRAAGRGELATSSSSNDVELTIEHTKTISAADFTQPEIVAACSLLFKNLLRSRGCELVRFGRSFHLPINQRKDVARLLEASADPRRPQRPDPSVLGLSLLNGFFPSISASRTGPQLCVDLTQKVISSNNVRYLMNEIRSKFRGPSKDLEAEMNRQLKGRFLVTINNKRTFRVDAVDMSKNLDSTFKLRDGGTTTFRKYYCEHYPETKQIITAARDPGLLVVIRKNGDNIYLVPDLCFVTGVSDIQRSDEKLIRKLAAFGRKPPSQRNQEALDFIRRVSAAASESSSFSTASAAPFTLSLEAKKVEARVLGPFTLIGPRNDAISVSDSKSDWSRDVRTGFYKAPPAITKWMILYDGRDYDAAGILEQGLQSAASQSRINLPQVEYEEVKSSGPAQAIQQAWATALQACFRKKPTVIFVVLPWQNTKMIYSLVKTQACCVQGVITQCVTSNKLTGPKGVDAIVGNCLKQALHKLGGVSWKVKLETATDFPYMKQPTMFVGIDVSHEPMDREAVGRPQQVTSTVGFVASYDPDVNAYHGFVSCQTKGIDFVEKSCELMKKACLAFKDKGRVLPQNIVIFRDGVSESQLQSFVSQEEKHWESAFAEIGPQYKPKVVCMILQKRISARFFQSSGPELKNPPLFSVIDSPAVTSPSLTDFYLTPTSAPKGASAKPIRVIVYRNDLNLTLDQLQTATATFCCSYANWFGPVKSPAPAFYAHKLALLFGRSVHGDVHQNLKDKIFYL